MAFTFSQVKIGNYEFIQNPEVVDNDEELLQTISYSLNGTAQVSYIPKSSIETETIKNKRSFTISGTENNREQIELIKTELRKKPPLYFRNAQNEEFQITVVEQLKYAMNADLWTSRKYSFKVKEI